MNPKTITTLFCVSATVLVFFAVIMYMKHESKTTMTITTFAVPHCDKSDAAGVCHGVVSR